MGYAKAGGGGAIEAVSKNAMQFGYGTNNVSHSLALGKKLRFRDDKFDDTTGGAASHGAHPTSNLRAGDFWVKNVGGTEYVYVRSGNANIKLFTGL